MEPLYVNIDLESSNAPPEVYQGENGWEEVDYSEVKLPDVRQIQILGHGSYGTVYKCTFRDRQVAVKVANNSNDFTHLLVEAKYLHGFCHPNIVNLYALFRGEVCGIVMELMEGGSLDEYFSCSELVIASI
uniref:Mitogen-activated protein kinase kinase kinase n=1 Tax=Meloidogyne floridensis TaxID=298350 RepID=A0A915NR71_9BILA